jgi:hypothetical protein
MIRKVLVSALFASVTLAAHSGTASADRKMLVLVDASGSMSTLRSDMTARYDAAIARSDSMILNQAMMGLDGVAIYTFSDSTATQRTAGFVDVNTARTILNNLNNPTPPPGAVYVPPGGVTPLAGSMCDAIDALVANTTASDIRIMQLSSDGEENATDPLHACFGPFSSINVEPFEAGSWQNKVYVKATTPQPGEADATVNVRVDLFNYTPVVGLLAAASASDVVHETGPTTIAVKTAARTAAAAAAAQPPTLEEFFGALAHATGGELNVIDDNSALPVEGDISDDGCVDFYDTLQVAVRFGQTTPAVDGKFDRDADGTVTFNDYLNVLAHVTPECVANSHVVAQNLHCKGGSMTVDGKFIDDAATTISAYGSCKLTIKNSIIVAGDTALKIYGAARVKIENSHIISASTLVDLWGAAFVSAKNSSLKGQVKTTGAVVFQDLGGNTWY